MDEVARYNQTRWKALAAANALFSRPRLDLDSDSARAMIDSDGFYGDVSGKNVLCLACGGGQQSAAFALLGADVTVVDLSPEQLERDAQVAEHYGFDIRIAEADMRDLSAFHGQGFDIVHHAYSLNFVRNCREVFSQVADVLCNGGLYRFAAANPFTMGVKQSDWKANGYTLSEPYAEGAIISYDDQDWVYDRDATAKIANPIEYRHLLSTLINGVIDAGFSIRHVSDNTDMHPDPQAEPASWDHFVAFGPPWLSFLARLEN